MQDKPDFTVSITFRSPLLFAMTNDKRMAWVNETVLQPIIDADRKEMDRMLAKRNSMDEAFCAIKASEVASFEYFQKTLELNRGDRACMLEMSFRFKNDDPAFALKQSGRKSWVYSAIQTKVFKPLLNGIASLIGENAGLLQTNLDQYLPLNEFHKSLKEQVVTLSDDTINRMLGIGESDDQN